MNKICILTDTSAQFTKTNFPGKQFVRVIPLDVKIQRNGLKSKSLRVSSLPDTANKLLNPSLSHPSDEKLRKVISQIRQDYDQILGIFISSKINDFYKHADEDVNVLGDKARIQFIDSQTISTGLGYIVQEAAAANAQGASFSELEQLVCSLITRVYAVFCIPGLSYLYFNKFLDIGQAMIGEMLDLLPVFALEDGKLTALEKLRNYRHATDFFQEFLCEFEKLEHISLVQSYPPKHQLTRLLRDHMREYFPNTVLSENRINLPLAVLLGPNTTGIIAVEAE